MAIDHKVPAYLLGYSLWICSHPIRWKGGEPPTELHLTQRNVFRQEYLFELPISVGAYGTGFLWAGGTGPGFHLLRHRNKSKLYLFVFCILWLIAHYTVTGMFGSIYMCTYACMCVSGSFNSILSILECCLRYIVRFTAVHSADSSCALDAWAAVMALVWK
jgi:hypothetical protein